MPVNGQDCRDAMDHLFAFNTTATRVIYSVVAAEEVGMLLVIQTMIYIL